MFKMSIFVQFIISIIVFSCQVGIATVNVMRCYEILLKPTTEAEMLLKCRALIHVSGLFMRMY